MIRIVVSVISALFGALLIAAPGLSRHELLFGVRVAPDFRRGRIGRRSVWAFRAIVAAATLFDVGAILLTPMRVFDILAATGPLAIAVATTAAYYWQNLKLRQFAQPEPAAPREAVASTLPEHLPAWAWTAAIPFILLAVAAIFLYLHWNAIPQRFPVHWGMDGRPNRWVDRTIKGVYGPLIFGAGIGSWLLLLGAAGWFGARRSRHRTVLLAGMIGAAFLQGFIFSVIALMPVIPIPIGAVVLVPLLLVVPGTVLLIAKMKDSGEPMERTPDECWKAGIFYYNPDDAALLVEKRFGVGYTLDFANRWCWALLGSLLVVLSSGYLILA